MNIKTDFTYKVRASAAAFILFISLLPSQSPAGRELGELHLFVFMGGKGKTVADITVRANGESAVTGVNGMARLLLPEGVHDVILSREGTRITVVSAPVVADEVTEVVVTLVAGPGKEPEVMMEAPAESGLGAGVDIPGSTGTLSGKVVQIEANVPIGGARVLFRGQDVEARTDASGRFTVELPADAYSVSIIHPDYATQTIEEVEVSGEDKTTLTVEMTPSAVELQEYTVTAIRIEGGVASLLEEKKESQNVMEVIGAEQISKSGDSDAAAALKRVTGLTVVDGKFVYVRGMGERYSSSLLNNATLPSPEPERRVVPLDLIPVDIIESISIQKTYTADMPAEFGGGAVNIRTRGYPDDFTASVTTSIGYNENSTGMEGLTYEGGELDWLGIDDGARAIPDDVKEASDDNRLNSSNYTLEELEYFGEQMPNIWSAEEMTLPPNYGVSATIGDKYSIAGNKLGFFFSLKYDNSHDYTEKSYTLYNEGAGDELQAKNWYDFRITEHSIDLGGILDFGAELGADHKINVTSILIRSTDNTTRKYEGFNTDSDSNIRVTTLRWVERMLWTEQVRGSHAGIMGSNLDWTYTYSKANRDEPDRRQARYDEEAPGLWLLSRRPEGNQRFYSTLEDENRDANVELTLPFPVWNDLEAKVVAGANLVLREREVDTRRFKYFNVAALPEEVQQLPPEQIFTEEHIGPEGLHFAEHTLPTDNYEAKQTINAYYLMALIPITRDLDLNAGARLERSYQQVVTFDLFSRGGDVIEAELDNENLLPAVNITWRFLQNMQLRAAYSQTVSRPEFRELSAMTFNDVIGGLEIVGNPDLERALITNYDLRWEWYPSPMESLSLALFYKDFEDPIEKTIDAGTNATQSYINAPGAVNMGVELEFRSSLAFLAQDLSDFYLAGNVAYVESEVELGDEGDDVTSQERPLEGQSPYMVNLTFGYDNPATKTSGAVLYNTFGERIVNVGSAGLPDIYEEPFQQLDFIFSQGLPAGFRIKFKAKNILDEEFLFTQGDEIVESYYKGKSYTLSLTWSH